MSVSDSNSNSNSICNQKLDGGSNYAYIVAYHNKSFVGKYRLNIAYNTMLETAEVVSKKIFRLTKNPSFTFDLFDVNQRIVYRYKLEIQSYSFMEYGDYSIRYDESSDGCKRFHENKFLPVLIKTIRPERTVPVSEYWAGDKINGLFRNDVSQYVYGNLNHLS
jgi:hypothetical protein